MLGESDIELEKLGQLGEKVCERQNPLFQFTGVGEETPLKLSKRGNGDESEGIEKF